MSEQKKQRKKKFVDRAVQGTLLLHIVGHWTFFLFATGALLLFVEMVVGDPRNAWGNLLHRHGPTVLTVLVLAPIFIRDLCKLSNRFAGPMVRLRRAMHDLAEGREVSPIHFRKHDFWKDITVDFNRVVERVQASTTLTDDATSPHDVSSHDEIQDPVPTAQHTCES